MPIGSIEKRVRASTHDAGVIRLGLKKESERNPGRYFPTECSYFVIDPKENPELVREYGEKPEELDIVFMHDDEELIAKSYLQMYRCMNPHEQDQSKRKNYLACLGKGLDPHTDAPTLAFWYDLNREPSSDGIPLTPQFEEQLKTEIKQYQSILTSGAAISSRAQVEKEIQARLGMLGRRVIPRLCRHMDCPDYAAKNCRGIMTLSFKIPVGSVFGEYRIQTGSTVTMQNILACINDVKENIKRFYPDLPYGRIAGIPLKLFRYRKQIKWYNPDKQKHEFSEHFPLKLEVNPNFKEKFQNVLKDQIAAIMLDGPPQALLPSPELPGATIVDTVCPEDLFPTAEERAQAIIEADADIAEREEAERATQQSQAAILAERAAWAQEPEIHDLMNQWESKLGRMFPPAKRSAHAQKFETRGALVKQLRDAVGPEQTIANTTPQENAQ